MEIELDIGQALGGRGEEERGGEREGENREVEDKLEKIGSKLEIGKKLTNMHSFYNRLAKVSSQSVKIGVEVGGEESQC